MKRPEKKDSADNPPQVPRLKIPMALTTSKLNLWVAAMLATLSMNGYCQDDPDGEKRWGPGGRPGEAQVAQWRAKREGREDRAAAPDGAATSLASAAPSASGSGHLHGGAPAGSSRPGKGAHSGARPGGIGMPSGGAIWLSESPPMRGDGARSGGARVRSMGGMGGMDMGGKRGGPPMKRLWLRAGNDPQKSGFAREDDGATTELLLVTPRSKPVGEPLPMPAENHGGIAFEMPAQGYYRVYHTSRRLHGETLSVSSAKAEITNFGHGGDEEEQAKAMLAPRFLESAPIEIVRERNPGEKLFFQLKSGDEQVFVVLQKGLPLPGARVRFVSHQGWSKEALSDEQGRVSFQVIRDYFPPWREFQKRFKATYLVIAEATAAESGSFKDQPYTDVRYQATLSGSYLPSPDDYLSYAWGLGIGLLIVLFCGVSVYLYRRRRIKPFQEVRFDEGN